MHSINWKPDYIVLEFTSRVVPQPLLSTRIVYILKFASEPVEQEREFSKHQYSEALHLRQAPALLSLQSKWKRENKPHCTFFVFVALSSETNQWKTKSKVLPLVIAALVCIALDFTAPSLLSGISSNANCPKNFHVKTGVILWPLTSSKIIVLVAQPIFTDSGHLPGQ